ncbi:undecaprenyl/decaprenyl-phosphate alpha-N-acetylglucosaminyl 1-phosphate transferase [Vagococcus sp. BWB3-3]|uniref:Undecaprenyl/decaprenyl-phosphate alpha-N-acetylglucosaminyl 1-phosphate transferase n=1 Tax=Vagococcus allomyrinae TaxID=2794353 RepID=A0A940PGT4_9ENTE|nr:MraY family glycosyltransferase [Vagococcus allomyrinae]MBP1043683.1 undecaprenyl/decaprenyl-phosphate alpha-N-acetylglucosaminyl 1-phosphate transferase [Vagococcus allomyrinae]
MNDVFGIVIYLFSTVFLSLIITPFVRWFAFKIGATDKPDARRINKTVMPTIGGLAIFLSFAISAVFIFDNYIPKTYILPILLAATVIIVTGIIDDTKELSPKGKLLGITIAACIAYFLADIRMESFSLPFIGNVELGILSFPATIIWILALTNAVNLIDGLDGLASGVSLIALGTMGIIANFFIPSSNFHITLTIFILIASIVGFFPYNFHPAKIFLGDTGALFLGFMIAIMSLQDLKNVTIVSLVTPLIILGVPITDTVFAIIRRYINKQPIASADKMHLHHRLLSLGFTHRGAVLTIYGLAMLFSFTALLLTYTSTFGGILLVILLLLGIELFVELIGLVGPNKQFLLNLFGYLFGNKKKNDSENDEQK